MTTMKIRTVSTDIILLFTHQWRHDRRRETRRSRESRGAPSESVHSLSLFSTVSVLDYSKSP